MIQPNFEAIIFDFGGVVINLDYRRTVNALSALRQAGLPPLDYRKRTDLVFFDLHETGKISDTEFRDQLRQQMHLIGDDQTLDKAWNAMILDLPDDRLDLLEQLKQAGKRIFLLSNTNAIHERYFKTQLKASKQYERFENAFEKIYYSHHLQLRKPHVEIFQYVIEEQQLNPDNTLFIDDTLEHVRGAKKAGLHAQHLRYGQETIHDLLR